MHHLYIELDPEGTTGIHRHFAGTEMIRLDEGDAVDVQFPTRARNRRHLTLHCGETVFFDATLLHQLTNTGGRSGRMFISRNYELNDAQGPDNPTYE